jgi:uncharacterized protein YndB with AHSA1/START domain/DNA-binding transcriptional ArsR family regulator
MVNGDLDDVFGSLADPTRRDILRRLLTGEMSVNKLAKAYNISLPAVSKHLKVLEAAGLISKERRGRQHFIHLNADSFQGAADHLLYYQTVLNKRLDSLDRYLKKGEKMMPYTQTSAKKSAMQTLTVSHIFDAPIEKVWEVYINPQDISQWWGAEVTEVLSCYNDVRVGGVWRFTFKGSDGLTYLMSGQYQEVEKPRLLKYTDGFGEADSERPEAVVTIVFEELPEGKTKLTKTSVASRTTHQLQAAWLKSAEALADRPL